MRWSSTQTSPTTAHSTPLRPSPTQSMVPPSAVTMSGAHAMVSHAARDAHRTSQQCITPVPYTDHNVPHGRTSERCEPDRFSNSPCSHRAHQRQLNPLAHADEDDQTRRDRARRQLVGLRHQNWRSGPAGHGGGLLRDRRLCGLAASTSGWSGQPASTTRTSSSRVRFRCGADHQRPRR